MLEWLVCNEFRSIEWNSNSCIPHLECSHGMHRGVIVEQEVLVCHFWLSVDCLVRAKNLLHSQILVHCFNWMVCLIVVEERVGQEGLLIVFFLSYASIIELFNLEFNVACLKSDVVICRFFTCQRCARLLHCVSLPLDYVERFEERTKVAHYCHLSCG